MLLADVVVAKLLKLKLGDGEAAGRAVLRERAEGSEVSEALDAKDPRPQPLEALAGEGDLRLVGDPAAGKLAHPRALALIDVNDQAVEVAHAVTVSTCWSLIVSSSASITASR